MTDDTKPQKRMPRRIHPPRRPGANREPREAQGLKEEIAMLRELNRWIVEDLEEDSPQPAARVRALEALGKSYTRLAALLRTEQKLGGTGLMPDALSQALKEVTQEIAEENRRR
jgi:hypothetical protein